VKTVIVYYSHSNNTRAAAELLNEKLNGKLVELKEEKKGSAIQAFFRRSSKLTGKPWEQIRDADCVYLMFPIWAGKAVPAINAFLRHPLTKFDKKEVYIVTFQASKDLRNSVRVHDFAGNLVRKNGGIIKETYAMQGGNMNVYIGDDAIKERMEKVRWDEL
jgi:hypothetical protein